jgi:transcriptional regulator with XRE-family HTH domain
VGCADAAAGDVPAEFGTRVRRARQAQGRSQAALAAAVGLTRSSIANIETGRQRPPVHVALLIAGALGVRVDQLLPSGPGAGGAVTAETVPGRQDESAGHAEPPAAWGEEALQELYAGIGARVQHARRQRAWTQSQLAAAVGLTRASIANLEAGRQRPPVHVAVLIARALGVPAEELLPSSPPAARPAERSRPR